MMKSIVIRDVHLNERSGEVTVTALVEDMVQVRCSTWNEPAEYDAAVCVTSFFQEDIDFDLADTDSLEDYLRDAEWNMLVQDYFD